MRFLPRIYWTQATTCHPDAEFEGWTLVIRWRRFVVELTFARAEQACVVCGCTEYAACMTDDGPCGWARPGLCTACVERENTA